MGTGIRAEVRIAAPTGCPVAEICGAADTEGYVISQSFAPEPGGTVTQEVAIDADVSIDDDRLTNVFTYGSEDIYRFDRSQGRACPCEYVERFGCPIVEARAEGDALFLAFHVLDTRTLRNVVTDLRTEFTDVSIRRLIESEEDSTSHRLVVIDRSRFTDRQYEVLSTAHRMGYFEYPRHSNAGEVAAALDISRATFTEHLTAAQTKLLRSVLAA